MYTTDIPMIINELKNEISGDIITTGPELDQYSVDMSIFSLRPQAVVFPKSTEDICRLVSFVTKHKEKYPDLSLTARAAGTDMTGGPLSESIVIGFTKYFNTFSIDGQVLTTEPGVYYRDFEKVGNEKQLMMPSYPASKSLAAFGGLVNNNSAGEKTLYYGKTADYVKEMQVVLSDGKEYTLKPLSHEQLEQKKQRSDFEGEICRRVHDLLETNYDQVQQARPQVSKNSSGYALWDVWNRESGIFDLTRLFVGAQGTLGIMTKAKLNLVPIKQHQRLAVLFFSDLKQLPDVVNAVRPTKPESLEIFDDQTMMLALRFLPQIAKKAGQNLLAFMWRFLPEAFIFARMFGLPKLIMLVEYSGDSEAEVEAKLSELNQVLTSFHVHKRLIHDKADSEKYWIIRRESFALLRKHVGKNKKATPFVDDFVVDPKYLPEVLPKVYEILKEHKIKATLAGHAGSGNVHIIPLMDLRQQSEREKLFVVADLVYDVVLAHHGSISAEHNDGLIRGQYVKKMFGDDIYRLFKEIKHIFDPHNIFNPGKKVNTDQAYVLSHINPEP